MDRELQEEVGVQFNEEAAAVLIGRMGRGDPSALTALYEKTNPLVFGLILKILGNPILAEEVLLDVYTHIWKQSTVYDPKRFKALEWLVIAARACAISRLQWSKQDRRRRKFSTRKMDPAMTVSPKEQKCARSSIESLVSTQQEILEWAYYSGLSCSEIAAKLGKPVGAIKTHARIGLSKLAELFRPLFNPET